MNDKDDKIGYYNSSTNLLSNSAMALGTYVDEGEMEMLGNN